MYNVGSNAFNSDDEFDFDDIDGVSGSEIRKVVDFKDYRGFDEVDGDNYEEKIVDEEEYDEDVEGYDDVWYIRLYDTIAGLKENIIEKFNSFGVFLYKYINGDYDVPMSDEDCEKEQIKLLKHKRKLEKMDNHEFWLRDHLAAIFETMFVVAIMLICYMLYLGDDSVVIWAIKSLLKYR